MITITEAHPVRDENNEIVEWISYLVEDGHLTGEAAYGETPTKAREAARKLVQEKQPFAPPPREGFGK